MARKKKEEIIIRHKKENIIITANYKMWYIELFDSRTMRSVNVVYVGECMMKETIEYLKKSKGNIKKFFLNDRQSVEKFFEKRKYTRRENKQDYKEIANDTLRELEEKKKLLEQLKNEM